MIIQYTFGFDPHSLFVVNAISLAAFAVAFFFAWIKQRDKTYWLLWMWANGVLSGSFIVFASVNRAHLTDFALANCLLILGIALRQQAVRVFFHREVSVWTPLIAVAVTLSIYLATPILGYGVVFAIVNAVIMVQIGLVVYELLKDRTESLPSRWGLAFAYGVVAFSSALRIIQGLFVNSGMLNLLPEDTLLTIHLLIASIHIVASGAFTISLAYERGISELRQMALRDPLTELYNRRAFELTLAKFKPADGAFAMVILDIDHFKRVNDDFGHAAGDIALKRCANILTRIFRKTDFIARIGGEEFVAILPETTMGEAYEYAERVRQAVEDDAFDHGGDVVRLTISAGVCQATAGSGSASDITRKADVSLYSAKNNGRNRVEMFAA